MKGIRTALVGAAVGMCFTQASYANSVWINEFHYDNTGADVGEFIEVASYGPTDLSGWSLQIYNGGTGTLLSTYDLSYVGTLDNSAAEVSLTSGALQNGSPDGFALVNSLGAVEQFLSYEGSFVAVDGSAAGLFSTDIGLAESGSTPIGYSLQLVGVGTDYSDFTWVAGLSSAGNLNAGQQLSTVPLPGALVLFVTGLLGLGSRKLFANG